MANLKLGDDPPVFEKMEGTVKLILLLICVLLAVCFQICFKICFKSKMLFICSCLVDEEMDELVVAIANLKMDDDD